MSNSQTNAELRQKANSITLRRTLYVAGAGLIPVPVVDTATALTIQILMVRDISRVYGVDFKEHRVKSIIGTLVGDVATAGFFKYIPGLGSLLGGLAFSTVGAAATYALGKVFTQHFAQGGTLLSFDPVKSRSFFQQELEKAKTVVANLDENAGTADMVAQNKALLAEIAALRQTLEAVRSAAPKVDLGNLQIVEGIGPKIEAALKAGGIADLEQLAAATLDAIQAILAQSKGNFGLAVAETWPQQAALAVKGDLAGLQALQAELLGGKVASAV